MFRCDENWELSRPWAEDVFKRVNLSQAPEWVVLFPEVNIITPTTTYLQNLQSDRYYLPRFSDVLYPRYLGLYNATTALSLESSLKFVRLYDVTINYDYPITLLSVFSSGDPIEVSIHVKEKTVARIPQKRTKMEKWLEKTWIEKEKQVHAMRQKVEEFATETQSSRIK